MDYNILDARNNLSKLIASVESGAEVTITRRGKPVARIVPIEEVGGPARGTGGSVLAWLAANPLPGGVARTPGQIESDIREAREAWG